MVLSSMFHTLSQRLPIAEAYLCAHGGSIDTSGWATFPSNRNPEVDI
jgi:hypothetical protein